MSKRLNRRWKRICNKMDYYSPSRAHRHPHLSHQLKKTIANTSEKNRSNQIMPRKTLRLAEIFVNSIKLLLSSSSSMSIHTSCPSSNEVSVQPKCFMSELEYNAKNVKLRKVTLAVLQTVKKYYTASEDYRTNRIASRSPRYGHSVLSYVAKVVEKVKWQITHFLDPKDPIFIIIF